MIERGNMTKEEYIAALEKENKSLKSEKSKLEKEKDKLLVELECLKKR